MGTSQKPLEVKYYSFSLGEFKYIEGPPVNVGEVSNLKKESWIWIESDGVFDASLRRCFVASGLMFEPTIETCFDDQHK